MSFILDALKKSETDRQRQNGPALFEVRVAPPRDRLPVWAVGLGVLLAVNLVIVAWVLLRRPAAADAAAPAATAMQPMQQPQPAQQQAQAYGTAMAPATPMSAQQGQAYPFAPGTVPVNGTAPTAPMGQTAGMTPPPPPAPVPALGGQQQPAPGGTAVTTPVASNDAQNVAGEKLNPDDLAPAADPGPPQPFGNHVSRGTMSGVPLYQDVASASHLPTLRLDLHVYAANPQDRFVMINMHKMHEGDTLPTEGVRVESITPQGAVLSHDGTRFLMPRD
jgi:general secretion pathway protein B